MSVTEDHSTPPPPASPSHSPVRIPAPRDRVSARESTAGDVSREATAELVSAARSAYRPSQEVAGTSFEHITDRQNPHSTVTCP